VPFRRSNWSKWKFAQSGPTAGQLELVAGTGTAGYNGDYADATQAQLYYAGLLVPVGRITTPEQQSCFHCFQSSHPAVKIIMIHGISMCSR
jgi:hypothetical protein